MEPPHTLLDEIVIYRKNAYECVGEQNHKEGKIKYPTSVALAGKKYGT